MTEHLNHISLLLHNLLFQPVYFMGLKPQARILSLFPCLLSQYMDYTMQGALHLYKIK